MSQLNLYLCFGQVLANCWNVSDLQKRTPQELQDFTKLEEAKDVLKQVLLHINEDKRKTESKTKIFDIVYEVNCVEVFVASCSFRLKTSLIIYFSVFLLVLS